MMKTTNETRRQVMVTAWDFYRTDLRSSHPRTFADALAGAWRFIKELATVKLPSWARGSGRRTVQFGSLSQSPIERSLTGKAYSGWRSHKAAYTTASVGY